MNYNNLAGMAIAGIGTIILCSTGRIAGESAVVLLGAILGYAFGYTNGNNKKTKEENKTSKPQ